MVKFHSLNAGSFYLILFLLVAVHGDCVFPSEWLGEWFQMDYGAINISSNNIEIKGRCISNVTKEDKFILKDEKNDCLTCIVIHQNHPNILQYKESNCMNDVYERSQCEDSSCDDFKDICEQIGGDAPLYSMFRTNGNPEPCPFKDPPFQFSYSKGDKGWCKNPMSSIDTCTDDSRLLFRYQACTDMAGTESTVEELECLASWKDGNQWYLVGKIYHETALTDEQKYRCFAYEPVQGEDDVVYKVAQSAEPTCSSSLTSTEGSRTMQLYKVDAQKHTCHFPSWITDHRRWHSLDFVELYHLQHHNTTIHVTGHNEDNEKRLLCYNILNSSTHSATIVVHVTQKCSSGYLCMKFYRRDGHIIEFQKSDNVVQDPESACDAHTVNMNTLPYSTLVTKYLHPRTCPYVGHFNVQAQSIDGIHRKRRQDDNEDDEEEKMEECVNDTFKSLVVGCLDSMKVMKFYSACSEESISAYSCHGSWEEDGIGYLIASSENQPENNHFCFVYTFQKNEEKGIFSSKKDDYYKAIQLSSIKKSCERNIKPGVTGSLAFNLTFKDHCMELSTGGAKNTTFPASCLMFLLLLFVLSLR